MQNRLGQLDSVNAPSPLGRHARRRVVKVFVVRFKEPEIDLVQLLVEDLLRKFVSVRHRIGSEKNSILATFEELAGGWGRAAQFTDARPNLHAHVRKPVKIPGEVLQIRSEIADVQLQELRFRMPSNNSVPGLQDFRDR